MRHGWIYSYESPPAEERCEELLDYFATRGISLAEPESGRVIRLSGLGEQISSSKEDILSHCKTDQDLSFNVYLGPSDNIFCAFHKINADLVRESYSLDGKTEQQSIFVIKILADLFAIRAKNRLAIAFVADKYAELHPNFHWDDFILGATTPHEWPIAMAFSKSFKRLSNVPSGYQARDSGTHILFTSDTVDWGPTT